MVFIVFSGCATLESMFAGVAALYLTGTRVRLLGHQAAEIVLFCLLFAIAVFAVIAAVYP